MKNSFLHYFARARQCHCLSHGSEVLGKAGPHLNWIPLLPGVPLRCGTGNEEESSRPGRTRRKRLRRQEGGGKGLVFYSCLKMKPKNEGVCHQAGRTWQISVFAVPDLLQTFFILTQQALLLSAGFSQVRAHDVVAVTRSGFESLALPRALYLGEVGNTSARLRSTAPRRKIGEGTLRHGLDPCCVTPGVTHRAPTVPVTLTFVLILYWTEFRGVTPKID